MKRILVTGVGGPAGLGAIKSLNKSDLNLEIIGTDMDHYAPGLYEADKGFVIPGGEEQGFKDKILKICRNNKIDVLLPTVDQELLSLSEISDKLESLDTKLLLPRKETIKNCRNKWKTYQISESNNLEIPKSIPVTEENVEEKLEEFNFPVVLRPFESRGARGISYLESKNDLRKAIKKAKKVCDKIMLQEFVPGPVYTVGCVLDKYSNVKGSVVLEKIKEEPETGGVAVVGKTLRNEEVRELGENYAKSIGWKGICGPEIKYDTSEDKYKLMEINPRLFGYNYLATVAGVNLSEIYIKLCEGISINGRNKYEENLKFIRSWNDKIVREIK